MIKTTIFVFGCIGFSFFSICAFITALASGMADNSYTAQEAHPDIELYCILAIVGMALMIGAYFLPKGY